MDHRWGHRTATDIDVRLACGLSCAGHGRLENVSISGAFASTELRPPLLSQVLVITYVYTDRGRERYEASAYVVRHAAHGIGLEWLDLDPVMLPSILAAGEIAEAHARAGQPSPRGAPGTVEKRAS
jgi:hypothetical protein